MHPTGALTTVLTLLAFSTSLLTTACSSGYRKASSQTSSGDAGAGAGGGGSGGSTGGATSGSTSGSGGATGGSGGAGGWADAMLDALIADKMAQAHMPGLAACIVKGGAVAACKGYGMANIEEKREVTPDTVFLIASISKTVTATALMQLWEKGAFGLDDSVDAAVPFSVKHPTSNKPVTYRGLLTHTASVRDNWDILQLFYDYKGDPDVSLADCISGYFDPGGAYYDTANFAPTAPGTQFEYSNLGVALAGYLGEKLGGKDFAALSKASIFEPLAMKRTSWHITDVAPADLAMPYGWKGGKFVPYGQYTFADYPDGGLRTSAADLARFLAAVSAGGVLGDQRILEEATVAEMMKVQLPELEPTQGLVFYHLTWNGADWVGHNGGESGVATDMFYRPSDGLGFVVLMNGDWSDETPIVALEDALVTFAETKL